jgi:K+-transporting ATPase ATPase A chain
MSQLSQVVGLTFQNFASAAVGLAVLAALVRGLARHSGSTLGNFWVDLTRAVIYILLPLAVAVAVALVSQGVVQTFDSQQTVTTLEGGEQTIALGPVAAQVAIKQLGTNGGGFFNANSAHPLENPNAWSNWLQVLAILLIPAGGVAMYGRMVGSARHGFVVFGVMAVLLLAGALVAGYTEQQGTRLLEEQGLAVEAGEGQAGGNMEGKETRFGIGSSALWATATTAASNGSVNSMHDSYTPLGGLVPLANMLTGEVIFGGVGAGMYGMFVYIILAVFIAGLMVGRTPEYLGKKVEPREMKAVMLAVLTFPLLVLVWLAIGSANSFGTDNLNNNGPHGFTEMLYAFTSGAANNGSAFAGLNADSTFYNLAIGVSILFGRFVIIIAVLAVAGSMVQKKRLVPGPGTFPTDGLTFGALLAGTILIVGLLTFFPVLALGPIVEQVALNDALTYTAVLP